MAEYSEATERVFKKSLELLTGKLDEARIDALRRLVTEGKASDLDAVEEILRPNGERDADR